MDYQIRLSAFEGPFDLLFHLIEQEKVDIWDIPIARITEQYLEYLASVDELDLESAGEYLVMAATLLAIKARLLLPQPACESEEECEEVDPRHELVNRLLVYRQFREAAAVLADLRAGRHLLYPRGQTPHPDWSQPRFTRPVGEATVEDLRRAMHEVLQAYRPPPATAAIPRRAITVEGCIKRIEKAIRESSLCSFRYLLPAAPTRQDVIVTFLALLELIHRDLLRVEQPAAFAPIEISRKQGENDA
ncbi:MAG: segregation and condensation protein A [Limnochordia bacterium]|jgi:segregation and condensation protein A